MDQGVARTIDLALYLTLDIVSKPLWQIEPYWLREGAVTTAVIQLKDALQLLAGQGHRIDFKDDIEVGDVTDLVARYRNAACHFGSPSKIITNGNVVSFFTVRGRGVGIAIGDVRLENPYQDDTAYFYGTHRLLHKRHLVRAANEAKERLAEAVRTAGIDVHLLTADR